MAKKPTRDAAPRRSGRASIKQATVKRVEREGRAMRAMLGGGKKVGDKKSSTTSDRRVGDSFVNYALNIGIGTNNALSGSSYGFNPITRIRTLLDWVYRGSWIGGMAIDLVADDMTRGGIELLSTNKPEDQQTIHQVMQRLRIWAELCDCVKWSRLYGGCLAVLLIDGQDPSTPLRIETVGRGKFRGLMCLDRWMVDPDLQHLVSEYGPHLGLPEKYRVVSDAPAMRNQTIHYTRVIRLEGIRLPYWQRIMENLWGLSVIERLYDRMVAFDSATQGAAQLVYKSYIRTYKMDGLRDAQTAGGDSMIGVNQMVEMMRKYQGIEGVTLIDGKDEFTGHNNTSFAGIGDALLQFGQQLSGALQIPLVRLFGQSPAGLNSTGESDLRTYYDGVLQTQESDLREGLGKVLRVVARSEGITLPDTFDFNFRPLWQLNETEKSTVSNQDTRMVIETEAAGLISERTALKELQQQSKTTGRWTNITPEMIEAASDIIEAPDPDVEGLLGGGEGAPEDPIKAGEKLAEAGGKINGEESGDDYAPPFKSAGFDEGGEAERYHGPFESAGFPLVMDAAPEGPYRSAFADLSRFIVQTPNGVFVVNQGQQPESGTRYPDIKTARWALKRDGYSTSDGQPPPTGGSGRRARDRRTRDNAAVRAIMNAALADPRVQRSLLRPDIDRSHDVRSGAVASRAGGKTYISSILPSEAVVAGKKIDPALPLNVHEQVEWFAVAELGLPYAQAHVVATAAERWFVTARLKLSWDEWEHWIDGELDKIEHGPRANPPPDPHVDIEAAIGHHRAQDANVEVIPDVLNAEGWFSVKVDGEILKDKNMWARRFRSEGAAAVAGTRFVKERGQVTEDGIRELVARYVTPENAKAAVAAALSALLWSAAHVTGPEFDVAIENTVARISDIAHVSAAQARELVGAALPRRARDGREEDVARLAQLKEELTRWPEESRIAQVVHGKVPRSLALRKDELKRGIRELEKRIRHAEDVAPYTEVAGLQVVIEQPKGSIRRWEGGQTVYPADYGYARRVSSAEGEQEWLDVIVGPHLGSRDVWVIDSVNVATGKFDEHKLVLGARNAREALGYFRGIYAPGFRRVGAVTHLSADSYEFKDWVARGDKTRPMQELAA